MLTRTITAQYGVVLTHDLLQISSRAVLVCTAFTPEARSSMMLLVVLMNPSPMSEALLGHTCGAAAQQFLWELQYRLPHSQHWLRSMAATC